MHLQVYIMSNGSILLLSSDSILLFSCALCPFTRYVYLNRKRDKHKPVEFLHVSCKKTLLGKQFLDAFIDHDPISISYEAADSRRKDEELFFTDIR